jgi:hypothetical protein
VYAAISAAVAAQHVKDMLDQAAQDHRAAAVRRTRRARSARQAASAGPARPTGHGATTAPC